MATIKRKLEPDNLKKVGGGTTPAASKPTGTQPTEPERTNLKNKLGSEK